MYIHIGCLQTLEPFVEGCPYLRDPLIAQEVNVPRNATRYKDLIPIDVSDESFQRLTFKPRKARNTKWSSAATDAPKEPKVMDLYPNAYQAWDIQFRSFYFESVDIWLSLDTQFSNINFIVGTNMKAYI